MSNDWRYTDYEYAACYIGTRSKHEYVYGSSMLVQAYSAQIPINNYRIEKIITHYFKGFSEMNDYIKDKRIFMSDSPTISFIEINNG